VVDHKTLEAQAQPARHQKDRQNHHGKKYEKKIKRDGVSAKRIYESGQNSDCQKIDTDDKESERIGNHRLGKIDINVGQPGADKRNNDEDVSDNDGAGVH